MPADLKKMSKGVLYSCSCSDEPMPILPFVVSTLTAVTQLLNEQPRMKHFFGYYFRFCCRVLLAGLHAQKVPSVLRRLRLGAWASKCRLSCRFSSGRSSVFRRLSPATLYSAGRTRGFRLDAPLPLSRLEDGRCGGCA